MGPIGIALLVGAFVAAFMAARYDQQARYHRTTDPPEGERRILPRVYAERYTAEGEAYLRRARRCRVLLYVLGVAAALAAWRGL